VSARVPVAAILLGWLAALPAGAGSRYSLRGEGEFVLPAGADVRAVGGADAATRVPGLASNPACLAFAERTRFSGSFLTEWIRTEELLPAGSDLRKEYDVLLPNLSLVFPLPGRLRFGTGLLVDRRQEGRIDQDVATGDGLPYRAIFEASGNVLRIPVLLARDAGVAQLGAGLDVQLANAKIRWRNDFPDGTGFVDSDDVDETGLWAVTWRAGLRVPLGDRAAVGAWGAWPRRLSGHRTLENRASEEETGDLELDVESETASRVGVGAEIRPGRGLRLAADWVHEGWEDVEAPLAIGTFRDVDRVAAGLEWVPSREGLRWPVRAGYRTETLHTLDGAGRDVREHAVTGGSGFTFADGRGEFDWFVEYVRRGDPDASEFHEQVVRFGVTLTGFEEWTGRRPPEDETEDW
jgi:hypothetical protein